MERELLRTEHNEENENLLPEIAELLNVSVSQLEQYPKDMQDILCRTYINECALGKDVAAEALNNILNLDINTVGIRTEEKQPDKPAIDEDLSEAEKNTRKNKRSFLMSRSQILQNAKRIAENNAPQRQRELDNE